MCTPFQNVVWFFIILFYYIMVTAKYICLHVLFDYVFLCEIIYQSMKENWRVKKQISCAWVAE